MQKVDSTVRAEIALLLKAIALLLKALELVCTANITSFNKKTGIPIILETDTPQYWIERAMKELE